MPEPVIAQNSPFVAKVEPGTYWWCACGKSKGQPFCDGSHKGTGLGPLKVDIAETRTLAWCGCKHSVEWRDLRWEPRPARLKFYSASPSPSGSRRA